MKSSTHNKELRWWAENTVSFWRLLELESKLIESQQWVLAVVSCTFLWYIRWWGLNSVDFNYHNALNINVNSLVIFLDHLNRANSRQHSLTHCIWLRFQHGRLVSRLHALTHLLSFVTLQSWDRMAKLWWNQQSNSRTADNASRSGRRDAHYVFLSNLSAHWSSVVDIQYYGAGWVLNFFLWILSTTFDDYVRSNFQPEWGKPIDHVFAFSFATFFHSSSSRSPLACLTFSPRRCTSLSTSTHTTWTGWCELWRYPTSTKSGHFSNVSTSQLASYLHSSSSRRRQSSSCCWYFSFSWYLSCPELRGMSARWTSTTNCTWKIRERLKII